MRFYLDEDLSPQIAGIARAQGLDVVSAHECGRNSLSDDQQLRLAADDGRCLVTRNRDDYVQLTVRFFENSWAHAGVLLVPRALRHHDFAGIAAALVAYEQAHVVSYAVNYLAPRRPT